MCVLSPPLPVSSAHLLALSEGSLLSVEVGSDVMRDGGLFSLSPHLEALNSHFLSPEGIPPTFSDRTFEGSNRAVID